MSYERQTPWTLDHEEADTLSRLSLWPERRDDERLERTEARLWDQERRLSSASEELRRERERREALLGEVLELKRDKSALEEKLARESADARAFSERLHRMAEELGRQRARLEGLLADAERALWKEREEHRAVAVRAEALSALVGKAPSGASFSDAVELERERQASRALSEQLEAARARLESLEKESQARSALEEESRQAAAEAARRLAEAEKELAVLRAKAEAPAPKTRKKTKASGDPELTALNETLEQERQRSRKLAEHLTLLSKELEAAQAAKPAAAPEPDQSARIHELETCLREAEEAVRLASETANHEVARRKKLEQRLAEG